jgi:hypothetical protein
VCVCVRARVRAGVSPIHPLTYPPVPTLASGNEFILLPRRLRRSFPSPAPAPLIPLPSRLRPPPQSGGCCRAAPRRRRGIVRQWRRTGKRGFRQQQPYGPCQGSLPAAAQAAASLPAQSLPARSLPGILASSSVLASTVLASTVLARDPI